MRRTLAVLLLAAVAGGGLACRSNGDRPDVPSAPRPVTPREVELAAGESAQVNGLTVKFEGVSADSRCPIGVQCFWEGDAVVLVSVSEPARPGAGLELHTSGRFPHEGTFGRYHVRLVALVPQPREGEPVTADRYRATLQITTE